MVTYKITQREGEGSWRFMSGNKIISRHETRQDAVVAYNQHKRANGYPNISDDDCDAYIAHLMAQDLAAGIE